MFIFENIDIDKAILENIDIDIDIFQNCLIDIDIFQNCLIDIFKYDHSDINIFPKCRYIDNRYSISIYRIGLLGPLNGSLRHSWGPQKGSFWPQWPFWGAAPGGQIWSRLPPIGPSGLTSCSPHTLTWYRASYGHAGVLKGPVLARNAPFGDLGGPRRALGDLDWSHLPQIGQHGLDTRSPQTLNWYQASSGPMGALKGHLLTLNFHGPILCGTFFF